MTSDRSEVPTIYVMGDAGYDVFEVERKPEPKREFPVAAGALYAKLALQRMLGDEVRIESLVSVRDCKEGEASPLALQPKKARLRQFDKVWLISSYARHDDGVRRAIDFAVPEQIATRRLLVAHHAGRSWHAESGALKFVEKFLAAPVPSGFDMVINTSDSFPELESEQGVPRGGLIRFDSPIWNQLLEARHRVAIVTSLTALRQHGALIMRELSCEQTVEDLAAELHRFPRLRALSQFRHLFVRLGVSGFVHIERCEQGPASAPLRGRVYFSRDTETHSRRDQSSEGVTVGRNTVFIAALAQAVFAATDTHPVDIDDVVARSLAAMHCVDDAGYDKDVLLGQSMQEPGNRLIAALTTHARAALNERPSSAGAVAAAPVVWCDVPSYVLDAPAPTALRPVQRWYMLDDALVDAPVHRINVAMAIVKVGHRRVFNIHWPGERPNDAGSDVWSLLTRVEYWNPLDRTPDYVTLHAGHRPTIPEWPVRGPKTEPVIGPICEGFSMTVPVDKFGKLILIERDEIETLRGIHSLLALYRTQTQSDTKPTTKPISLAVFGPPGSGKSFAVKQIADELGGRGVIPQLEFNLSQFRDVDDLGRAFEQITTLRNGRREVTPLVFFDEFDCSWDAKDLGWLKYFLAPMQDGTFQNKQAEIGPAIFVFAGGIHSTFERFDPTTDAAYDNLRDSEDYKRRLKAFIDQKGPDFISRLRGHINVREINEQPGGMKHFIRRAVQLRSLLEQNGRVDTGGLAKIDDAIVYALLTVDRYRHGVRSMQALVEMCMPMYERIDIASLPPRAQLNMHVDAEEFLTRVHRGRARSEPRWQYTFKA